MDPHEAGVLERVIKRVNFFSSTKRKRGAFYGLCEPRQRPGGSPVLGPKYGGHQTRASTALFSSGDKDFFAAPAFPLEDVFDPTERATPSPAGFSVMWPRTEGTFPIRRCGRRSCSAPRWRHSRLRSFSLERLRLDNRPAYRPRPHAQRT